MKKPAQAISDCAGIRSNYKINNGRWPDSGRNAAQPDQRSGLFKGFGMLPNKQKRQFPVTPGIAVLSLCIYKDIACKVSEPAINGQNVSVDFGGDQLYHHHFR